MNQDSDFSEETVGRMSAQEAPDAAMDRDQTTQALTVEGLQARVEELEAECKKHYDQYLRAMAEMENIRKRTAREREEFVKFAALPFIKQMLGIMDDLERALAMSDPDGTETSLHKGVQMIFQRMQEVVRGAGVEPLEAVGKTFDPQYHQPLAVEASDLFPENTVVEEMQKGYVMHGRLVRPSLVKVSG